MAIGETRRSTGKKTNRKNRQWRPWREDKQQRSRSLHMERFEQRMLLAATPVSVQTNDDDVLADNDVLDVAPMSLTFNFDAGDIIDATTLDTLVVTRAGEDGSLNTADDVEVPLGFVGLADRPHEMVARFAEALPDDLYRIRTDGSAGLTLDFELDLGAKVVAVVAQPIIREVGGELTQTRNEIVVYFNNDDLDPVSAETVGFYQLISTVDNSVVTPTAVAYDATSDTAVLTFGVADLADLPNGAGTYRLRIGDSDAQPAVPITPVFIGDVGSSFDLAADLGTLGTTQIISEAILNPISFDLTLPGSNNDPGHRDLAVPVPGQQHVLTGADTQPGISTIFYNFKDVYGFAPDTLEPLHNVITENQKQRAREVFEFYSESLGVEFVETAAQGFTIATGDLRAIAPTIPTGPGGVAGIAGGGTAIMDAAENWGTSEFGGGWFRTGMHEIGHLLGLGHTHELAPLAIMGSDGTQFPTDVTNFVEPAFPGEAAIVHGQHIFRPESIDIDLFQFMVPVDGIFSAEIFAERLDSTSLLDSALTLFNRDFEIVARNDDYFSEDSFLELELTSGIYYIAVTSTGNTDIDPRIEHSGFGGTTQGAYELRLDFQTPASSRLVDTTGVALDGDADGSEGGTFNYWFDVADVADTIYVDKAATGGIGALGSITNPFTNIDDAFGGATAGDIVRIVGNGGADGDVGTLDDNLAYEIGFDIFGSALADGTKMDVPQDVTVMVDAGAVFKLRRANIQVGSSTQGIDRSEAALQILGTPEQSVYFTSWFDETTGLDTDPFSINAAPGDWGGIVIQDDIDRAFDRPDAEAAGIFLNHINFADVRYGGGQVVVDSVLQTIAPIHLVETRPTITYGTFSNNAGAPISADPNSFEETLFGDHTFDADYRRVGPDIHGNRLFSNTVNGLFVRTEAASVPGTIIEVEVTARWDDYDIVHVVAENLQIAAAPGGPTEVDGPRTARLDGGLIIDPDIVVKLNGSRIETKLGGQFIAEGTPGHEVIFTSIHDDSYGAGGTFDTDANDPVDPLGPEVGATAGDWGGLFFGHLSRASLDNVTVAYGGGITAIEGDFAQFNAVEIHQAEVRIANSHFINNASGNQNNLTTVLGSGGLPFNSPPANAGEFFNLDIGRNNRGANSAATIFVRGSQPIIVNNVVENNLGPVINIDVNSLDFRFKSDIGRSTGAVDLFDQFDGNRGPLVQGNRLANNLVNGMVVRGGVLTTQSVWDDADIAHVVINEIRVDNHHAFSGLRLESRPNESLVVKLQSLSGGIAGFTATGTPFEIDDRIGGSVQVIGQPGAPVVLTSFKDDTVGAGFDPDGNPQLDTDNAVDVAAPGDWRSIRLEAFSNDRNVHVVNEAENKHTGGDDVNFMPDVAQFLGELAPDQRNGDDNRRIGFEVHGAISFDDTTDIDVYSFRGQAGTEVWIDIDQTRHALDVVVELVDANGGVIARSDDSPAESNNALLLTAPALVLQRDAFSDEDLYTTNPRDAGMRVLLPGPAGLFSTYFVRVRSKGEDIEQISGGITHGEYQLQIRLQEVDEFPGSTVSFADIRFATNGIEILGAPFHSPLLGTSTQAADGSNVSFATAQDLGNLLASDQGTIDVSSFLLGPGAAQWFKFTVDLEGIQSISNFNNSGTSWATIFDIDYADGASRPDLTLAVFNESGELILVSRDSNIADDLPRPLAGADTANPGTGSFGTLDPFIGSAQLPEGDDVTYFVAVMSDLDLPAQLNATFQSDADNPLVRLEPVNSVNRIVEDHIGSTGYSSNGAVVSPVSGPILGISDAIELSTHVRPFMLSDVTLFISQGGIGADNPHLFTVDPFTGAPETDVGPLGNGIDDFADIVIRDDGQLFGFQEQQLAGETVDTGGQLVHIDPGNAAEFLIGRDNIPDDDPLEVPPDPNTVTIRNIDALAYRRGGFSFSSRYSLHYSVRDIRDEFGSNPRSSLFLADATDGHADFQQGRPEGFLGHIDFANFPPGDPDAPPVDNIGFTTGMAFVQRIGITLSAPNGSLISDGQTFSISDAERTVTFEFDDGSGTSGTNFPVMFSGTDDELIVGQSIRNAIVASGLNVEIEEDPFGGLFTNFITVFNAFAANKNDSFVTVGGLPNGGSTFYGVSELGVFYEIDEFSGLATFRADFGTNRVFTGLAIGPQNLDLDGDGAGGDLASTLFAITANGDLYAIDTVTNELRMDVFAPDEFANPVDHVNVGIQDITGLAFSTLDFNLWHPTVQDAASPGHGINPTEDGSRNAGRPPNGGESFYFGLENAARDFLQPGFLTFAQETQFGTQTPNAQFGILSNGPQDFMTELSRAYAFNATNPPVLIDINAFFADWADDLRDNTNAETTIIGNNFNLPGGAHGSLITNGFNLEGYSSADKPTLYFNYFLDAEGADGIRDAARVFSSTDGGTTWQMLATNNSNLDEELPEFVSTSVSASVFDPRQSVQDLFETTMVDDPANPGTLIASPDWRQARIDLGDLAGASEVLLRFDFSSSGDISDPSNPLFSAPLPGDQFGDFNSGERGQNNNFKGFFIDDIVVGFTERGEIVTAAEPLETNEFATDTFTVPLPTSPDFNKVLTGSYQLQIRRGNEFFGPPRITETFDTNDRSTEGFTLRPSAGAGISDGQAILITDGVNSTTFEFDIGNGVAAGSVAVPFDGSESAAQIATQLEGIINSTSPLQVTARASGTDNRLDLFDAADALLSTPAGVGSTAATGIEAGPSTALADYVNTSDAVFGWTLDLTINDPDFTAYVLDVTTQTWRSPAEVSPSDWQHFVTVIVPNTVVSTTALLAIGGGNDTATAPTSVAPAFSNIAVDTQSVVVILPTIPNQPTTFTADGIPRTEDSIIAYTFDQYLNTLDQTWPLLLPMVKSAVRVMDATQDFLLTKASGPVVIDDFVVTGGSKRGWTTYLTAAVDPRVSGIVPLVFNFLNMGKQVEHHRAFFEGNSNFTIGGFSFALFDYVSFGITDRFDTPAGQTLGQIVDPYAYRAQLTMPKLLIHSTGDEFFIPDSGQFYLDDLPGQTYLQYIPNTGHSLNASAVDSTATFYQALITGTPLPNYNWDITAGGTINVDVIDTASLLEVNLWQATNPLARDFRWGDGLGPGGGPIGPVWTSTTLPFQASGDYSAFLAEPPTGASAYMIELVFDSGLAQPFTFTTDVVVTSPIPLNENFVEAGSFGVTKLEGRGDRNAFFDRPFEKGEIFIHSNRISDSLNYGIFVDAFIDEGSPFDPTDTSPLPHTGSVRNLTVLNGEALVGGVTIENNIIAFGGDGGIMFSGSPNPANQAVAASLFGRITNNTIFGDTTPTGTGITLSDSVSPTILNNIVAGFETGISDTSTPGTTVIGATVYQDVTTLTNNGNLGQFAIILDPLDPLFTNSAGGDFLLADGSLAIDSSIDILEDRPAIVAVNQPLGIGESPIRAPDRDVFGQLRQDDPNIPPPPGLGANVFRDRGAVERVAGSFSPLISIDDPSIEEGDSGTTNLVFTVTLSSPSAQFVTVDYITSEGTAIEGDDYLAAAGALVFVPGQTSQTISVTVQGDTAVESNETFLVELSNPINATFSEEFGEGTILDDDNAPFSVLTINDRTVNESLAGDAGTTIVNFTVSLSSPSTDPVMVDFATADLFATAGLDYTAVSGTLTFAPGSVEQTIPVEILGDTLTEISEFFTVNLTNPAGATIGDSQGLGEIVDDDAAPAITLSINDIQIIEPVNVNGTQIQQAEITITLSAPSPDLVIFNIATIDVTATAGADYVPVNASFFILPTTDPLNPNLFTTVTISVKGDGLLEGSETFFVELSNASPALVGISDSIGIVTIVDPGGVDAPGPPKVTEVLASGTEWDPTFFAHLTSLGLGTGGFSIPTGSADQLLTLPWRNTDQFKIRFSENVVVSESDLTVTGINVANYSFAPGGFSYDPVTFTATWTLDAPIGADRVVLTLSDTVQDATAAMLDGEWVDGVSALPSGNGTAGGNFVFGVNVLPGDASGNEDVQIGDFTSWADRFDAPLGTPGLERADFDANGAVEIGDFTTWADNFGSTLPSAVSTAAETVLLPGDADGNGVVDIGDFTYWADMVGRPSNTPGWKQADFNNDGAVDIGDFTTWTDHFGQTLLGGGGGGGGGLGLAAPINDVAQQQAFIAAGQSSPVQRMAAKSTDVFVQDLALNEESDGNDTAQLFRPLTKAARQVSLQVADRGQIPDIAVEQSSTKVRDAVEDVFGRLVDVTYRVRERTTIDAPDELWDEALLGLLVSRKSE